MRSVNLRLSDNLIYALKDGKMVRTGYPIKSATPDSRNFLIVAEYGDWSGFRTLSQCEAQIEELEGYYQSNNNRVYAIVERF